MTDDPIVFKAEKVTIEFNRKQSDVYEPFNFPSSFEMTGTFVSPASDKLLEWARQSPNSKKVLQQVESIMKEYNITPDRIVSDRSTLQWLFLGN